MSVSVSVCVCVCVCVCSACCVCAVHVVCVQCMLCVCSYIYIVRLLVRDSQVIILCTCVVSLTDSSNTSVNCNMCLYQYYL